MLLVSPISLMANPTLVDSSLLDGIQGRRRDQLLDEFHRRGIANLCQADPQILLVDFTADVRHGCIRIGDTVATRNRWGIVKTRLFRNSPDVEDLLPGTDSYLQMWEIAVDSMVKAVRLRVPNVRIVLHQIENCLSYFDDNDQLRPFVSQETLLHQNVWWQDLNARFARQHADAVINVFDASRVFSNTKHPWGAWPVHFSADYSRLAFRKLIDVTSQA